MRIKGLCPSALRRYRKIDWLMPSVDVEKVLKKLGCVITKKTSKEIRSYCPDHHLYVGHESSDPNWVLYLDTGGTMCQTEGRPSNLVWTVCRLLDCTPNDAANFLMGKESGEISDISLAFAAHKAKMERMRHNEDDEVEVDEVKGLNIIEKEMNERFMTPEAYQFFMHPPAKNPTNIVKDTVDRYKVFQRTWGLYEDRVIIPFLLGGELKGFVATDMLGKEEWMKRHPSKDEKEYRKTRYPENFSSGSYLFGYDDCVKGCDHLIIVEGAREVMKLWQEGFTNSVAILGCYMSDKHIQMIAELFPKKIILMFDGDKAGRATTDKIAAKLDRNFPGDRLIKTMIPEGKDPKNLNHDEIETIIRNS